jgi:hypothetical protein
MSLLVLSTFAANEMDNLKLFDNYTKAYRIAQTTERPMLVVLNPSQGSGKEAVALDEIAKSEESRVLLSNYVVTVIDAESEHGKTCQKLFDCKSLPYIAVIDKQQKYQLYHTSQKLDGKVWNTVLKTYKTGQAPAPARPVAFNHYQPMPMRSFCPNCR